MESSSRDLTRLESEKEQARESENASGEVKTMKKVMMGKCEFELDGKYITEMRDSNDILGDTEALRKRMQEDGYLLIRGLHNREEVLDARMEALQILHERGKLDPNYPLEEGVIAPGKGGGIYTNKKLPKLVKVVEGPRIMGFFDRFLGGECLTYDFKWARNVSHGESSPAHYDIVYMGRGTKNLYTCWTPLCDISYEMGGVSVCLGSHHFEKIKQTYGRMDVDSDRDDISGEGFSNDPLEMVDKFGGRWATTEFKAGDALIFGMYLMHGSLTNTTNQFRLSVDTRYQLRSDPVDERWVGESPKGHYRTGKIGMKEARDKWGI